MSSNKRIREKVEQIYGKGCMFKKAGIEGRIERIRSIKTYKRYIAEKRYTSKKIKHYESIMSYHHLKHKSDGGGKSVENGAVINSLAHSYLHSLPRHHEEIINNMLRQYKINVAVMKGTEIEAQQLEFDLSDYIEIPLERDNKKYNRAKVKREWEKKAREGLDEYYR